MQIWHRKLDNWPLTPFNCSSNDCFFRLETAVSNVQMKARLGGCFQICKNMVEYPDMTIDYLPYMMWDNCNQWSIVMPETWFCWVHNGCPPLTTNKSITLLVEICPFPHQFLAGLVPFVCNKQLSIRAVIHIVEARGSIVGCLSKCSKPCFGKVISWVQNKVSVKGYIIFNLNTHAHKSQLY